jgi:hypothetical protein
MIFYARERTAGFTPRADQVDRKEKWRLRVSRIWIAVIVLVLLAIAYFVLREHGLVGASETARSAGELVLGGLIGVFLTEREATKVINIYIDKKGGANVA